MNFPYEDIVSLPHPVSARHAPMSAADRAAQFSPFAALNGHGAAIQETARLTEVRAELHEDEKARINEQLVWLALHLSDRPLISVTAFVRDCRKEGGAYVTVTGILKKMDNCTQSLVLEGGEILAVSDICDITLPS